LEHLGELENIITAVYNKEGKQSLTERELAMSMSMGLHWFKLEDARQVVDMAKSEGLLKEEEDGLVPTFDITTMDLPLDYKPSEDVLSDKRTEDILMTLVDLIVRHTNLEKTKIMSHINKKKNQLGVHIQVAALLVAKRYDIDVSKYYDVVENNVLEG
jgi:hypothetical protein